MSRVLRFPSVKPMHSRAADATCMQHSFVFPRNYWGMPDFESDTGVPYVEPEGRTKITLDEFRQKALLR